MSAPKDLYQVLALPRNATPEQVRMRFRALARERHPDRFSGEDRARAELEFQEITAAFNVLASPERRRAHDLELARPAAAAAAAGGTDQSRLARFHLEAGVAFYRDANYFAAAESFERVTALEPKSHQAWHHLAQSLAHQKTFLPRAIEAITRACELSPVNVGYLKLAGRLNAEAGLPDRAEQYYNQAITWGGEDPVVMKALEELRASAKKTRGPLSGRSS